MKYAYLFAALLTISAPALAQEAGAPGATGVGGSLTGSNPGTGFYPNWSGPYYGPRVYGGPPLYVGPGPYFGPWPPEGRAIAPDYDDYDD